VAALSELLAQAHAARLETQALRAQRGRLMRAHAARRRDHVRRRQRCTDTMSRSVELRDRMPTWPAWSGPTPDLRSTLVPLD
jgi:hypothetical protein